MKIVRSSVACLHRDDRGVISGYDGDFRRLLIITMTPGSRRGDHRHRADAHLSVVLGGVVDYYERDGEGAPLRCARLHHGDAVFTEESAEHVFVARSEATMAVGTRLPRLAADDYERDIVRTSVPIRDADDDAASTLRRIRSWSNGLCSCEPCARSREVFDSAAKLAHVRGAGAVSGCSCTTCSWLQDGAFPL